MIKSWFMRHRGAFVLTGYILVSVATYLCAFLLRFDARIPLHMLEIMMVTLPAVIVVKISISLLFKLHLGLWSHAGLDDLTRIIKACTFSTLILVAGIGLLMRFEGFPRSVFVIDWILSILALGGKRLFLRVLRENLAMRGRAPGTRTLIVGAGSAGEQAARELMTNAALGHEIAGFLDDDPNKQGMMIRGVSVLGTLSDVQRIAKDQKIAVVLLAIPSARERVIKQMVEACSSLQVRLRILPAISDLISGRLVAQRIRDVQVEDLLSRDPIRFDSSDISDDISGTSVLVTGAGGSIGSELARQIAIYKPAHLLLLDNGETPLFNIHNEIKAAHPELACTPVIADVRDGEVVRQIFEMHRPQRIYHAAAYKHVPLMERYPAQAILNNVRGTRILASTALEYEVERFVMVSTDKAVKPKSIMGASKRICELVATSYNGKGTHFSVVRFGNVLGSNGSVIPTFRKQIEDGGPVTVTHADMTRYFMTIPEAVSLLLQCGTLAEANDTYVLDMGVPIKIMDLAKSMISLSGLTLGKDIDIDVIGLRPGEKIHEELVTYGESISSAGVDKINVVRNSSHKLSAQSLRDVVARLEEFAEKNAAESLLTLLWGMIALDQEISEMDQNASDKPSDEGCLRKCEQLLGTVA